jgi:hypothetical protein
MNNPVIGQAPWLPSRAVRALAGGRLILKQELARETKLAYLFGDLTCLKIINHEPTTRRTDSHSRQPLAAA